MFLYRYQYVNKLLTIRFWKRSKSRFYLVNAFVNQKEVFG